MLIMFVHSNVQSQPPEMGHKGVIDKTLLEITERRATPRKERRASPHVAFTASIAQNYLLAPGNSMKKESVLTSRDCLRRQVRFRAQSAQDVTNERMQLGECRFGLHITNKLFT